MCSFTCGNGDHKITLCLTVLVYILKSNKYLYLSKETEFLKHVCTVRCNQIQTKNKKKRKKQENN